MILVWQSHDRNEWATAIGRSLSMGRPPSLPVSSQSPFSLAASAVTQGVLTAAGFTEVGSPTCTSRSSTARTSGPPTTPVLNLWQAKDLDADLDARRPRTPSDGSAPPFAGRDTGNGVLFDSRAWIVTTFKVSAPKKS